MSRRHLKKHLSLIQPKYFNVLRPFESTTPHISNLWHEGRHNLHDLRKYAYHVNIPLVYAMATSETTYSYK